MSLTLSHPISVQKYELFLTPPTFCTFILNKYKKYGFYEIKQPSRQDYPLPDIPPVVEAVCRHYRLSIQLASVHTREGF